MIPPLVHKEVLRGRDKGYADVPIIELLIDKGKIEVVPITKTEYLTRANDCCIQGGEAEAVALFLQERAAAVVSDDDNVRKNGSLLDVTVIGTPAIVLNLYRERMINETKARQCITNLRKIGWFSNTVMDTMLMEVENGRRDRRAVRRRNAR
jgi:predicted nucleic acid-binding protein